MRVFHIDEFPSDRTWILLEKSFHNKLFSYIRRRYKFNEFNCKYFNGELTFSTYKRWRQRASKFKKQGYAFIPLSFLIKISRTFSEFRITKIEENIIAYKGPSSSTIIWKPNLPLMEDERLVKIISHFIGDGHVGGAFGTRLAKGKAHSEYRNYDISLLDKFEIDLKVFGSMKISKDYKHGHILVPNLIGYILEHIYKIKFGCKESKIPRVIFKLEENICGSFIKAFFDDEAHFYDNSVEVYSTNKNLLYGFIKLFKKRFPQIRISKLKTNLNRGRVKYSFSVLRGGIEDYNKKIGSDSKTKRLDLNFILKRDSSCRPKYRIGIAKYNIMKILKKSNSNAKMISRKLGIGHSATLDHLHQLKEIGKVNTVGKGKYNDNLWGLVNTT